jgi:hypothetical protein
MSRSLLHPFLLMPRAGLLASPLKKFNIPIVSWCPNELQLRQFQEESRITYAVPGRAQIQGREWYRVPAYEVNGDLLGEFLLPGKYYPLWRRLVYGALLQEKMYEGWIKRTRNLEGKMLVAVRQEEIRLRDMAGVRLVQYLLYRRVVLEELINLRFDNTEPVVHSLIEFGIRESRDWLFDSFADARKQGPKYLRLDPTAPENRTEFGECQEQAGNVLGVD